MPGIRPLSTACRLPALPGFEGPKTYAAWPVWSGSVAKEIKFQPMPKKVATRLYHRARDFDRQTHKGSAHDLSKIARQAKMSVLSPVCATFVCGINRRKRQPNQATFLSKTLFQNASERQRNFEQAASVRFWTNRAATPPSAAWTQMSAI